MERDPYEGGSDIGADRARDLGDVSISILLACEKVKDRAIVPHVERAFG